MTVFPHEHSCAWAQARARGTCLHTDKQAAAARRQVPKHKPFDAGRNAPCTVKFPFVNNTGYAFSAGRGAPLLHRSVPAYPYTLAESSSPAWPLVTERMRMVYQYTRVVEHTRHVSLPSRPLVLLETTADVTHDTSKVLNAPPQAPVCSGRAYRCTRRRGTVWSGQGLPHIAQHVCQRLLNPRFVVI